MGVVFFFFFFFFFFFSRVPNALRLDQPWRIIIKAIMITVGFAVLMIVLGLL